MNHSNLIALTLTSALGLALIANAQRIVRTQGTYRQSTFAPVGDINDDGYTDIAFVEGPSVLPIQWDPSVISGKDGAQLWGGSRKVLGSFPFYYASGGASDFDGDGYQDLLTLVSLDKTSGIQWVVAVSLRSKAPVLAFPIPLTGPGGIGPIHEVQAIGDVDGDGFDDILFGAMPLGSQRSTLGSVFVFSGRDGHVLRSFRSTAGTHMGGRLAPIGDIDGDGFEDVLVDDIDTTGLHVATVHSIHLNRVLLTITASSPSTWLSVRGVGDSDGDGCDDLSVFDPGHIPRARIISGKTSLTLLTIGPPAGPTWWIESAGDVDGDGVEDILSAEPLVTTTGKVHLYSGASGKRLGTVPGPASGAYFGQKLGTVGDIDNDGFDEFGIVGFSIYPLMTHPPEHLLTVDMDYVGTPARVRPYGAGCPGTNGHRPTIDHRGHPFIGKSFRLDLRGALPRALTFLSLGAPQQIPLAPFGLPGCHSYVMSNGFTLPRVSNAHGMAHVSSILVPNDPNLIGLSIHAQWIASDIKSNPAGVTFSNALDLRFGR